MLSKDIKNSRTIFRVTPEVLNTTKILLMSNVKRLAVGQGRFLKIELQIMS